MPIKDRRESALFLLELVAISSLSGACMIRLRATQQSIVACSLETHSQVHVETFEYWITLYGKVEQRNVMDRKGGAREGCKIASKRGGSARGGTSVTMKSWHRVCALRPTRLIPAEA